MQVRSGSNIQWKLRSKSSQNAKGDNNQKETATKNSTSPKKRNSQSSSKDSKVPLKKSETCQIKSRSLPRDTRFSEFIEIEKKKKETTLEDNVNSSILIDTKLYDDVLTSQDVIGKKATGEEKPDLNFSSISISSYNLSNRTDTSGYSSNNNTNSSNSIQFDDNDTYNINNNIIRNRFIDDNKTKKKYKREFAFAKNVLHYVPISSHVKRYKKLRKSSLSSSMGSLKNHHLGGIFDFDDSCRSRSLSREELKYVKISSPTNFVHVASATNPKLLASSDAISGSEQTIITHEQKFVDLRIFKVDQLRDSRTLGNLKGEFTSYIDF